MFAVFAYIVYFTFLWMLFVSDEPAATTQQQKFNLHKLPVDKPESTPQRTFINSIHPVAPPVALATSGKVAKDLSELGIRELRELSKGRIRGFMRLNKAELIHALQ